MPQQLPTILLLGAPNQVTPVANVLQRSEHVTDVITVAAASDLLALTNSDRLPNDGQPLAYLFAPSFTVDMPGVTATQIIQNIRDARHATFVLGIGSDGDQLAQEAGVPVLRPGMDLVRTIAKQLGIQLSTGSALVPAKPTKEPATDLHRGATWREARNTAVHAGSQALEVQPGSDVVWRGARRDVQRSGEMPFGHQARGFIMVVAARKGGVGKTTMSVNTAAYLGAKLKGTGRRVVLIDMNLQQADVSMYLGRNSPTVYDLHRNPGRMSAEHIESALVHMEKENFWALLGPATIREANPSEISVDMYVQIIDTLRDRFDYIIIDTPVAEPYHPILLTVLPMANYVIAPIAPARVTLNSNIAWLRTITAPTHANGLGVNPRQIGLVLNRAKLGIGLDPQEVEDHMTSWKFIAMFPDSDEWQRAENEGRLIGSNPGSELDKAFHAMLSEATGDPALAGDAPDGKGALKKRGFLKRLLG